MTAIRTLIVLATWPFVWAIDKARGINPPAQFATGMRWARTGERQDRMTAPADRLRHLLTEAARNAVDIYPDTLAAIIDAQMAVFDQVTDQTRKRVHDNTGRMGTEHRLVALTPFQPGNDRP